MNSYKLKVFACITMLLDHIARLFSPAIYPLIYIGRFAFPIFAFQASYGFEYTKNIKKYILRLFIFALISQIPFALYIAPDKLNVIFTILFGVLALLLYKKLSERNMYPLAFLSVAFMGFIAEFLRTDYGCYGVFIIFLFYIARNKKVLTVIGFTALTTMLYLPSFINYGMHIEITLQYMFTLIAITPILLYNEQQGKKVKYLIYIFYPAHLFVLYLIKLFI